jgi:hypothetical protein
METVLGLAVIAGLLAILSGLVLVGSVGGWLAGRGRPVPARVQQGGGSSGQVGAAAMIAIGLERAEGVAGLGRHDERRCGF